MAPQEILLYPGESLLLYAATNGGKTTQLRKLIEAICTPERKARVCVVDQGGTETILRPLVERGICELEVYDQSDRFLWIDNACQGRIWREGKWIDGQPQNLGLWAMEGIAACATLLLGGLGQQAADGFNVGGEPAPTLRIQKEGQDVRIGANSGTHYGVAQSIINECLRNSMKLPCPIVWTTQEEIVGLERKKRDGGTDIEAAGSLGIKGVIGPAGPGQAMTLRYPEKFVFCFRISKIPSENANRTVLYTGRHKDGALEGLANARCDVPLKQEPADVVAMLRLIRGKLK